MTDNLYFDAGLLRERARDAAYKALADPDGDYGLGDIEADESTLAGIFQSQTGFLMLLEGTLEGCLKAFSELERVPALVAGISGVPAAPDGVWIDADQFQTVIDWFKKSLSEGLDDAARSTLVSGVLSEDDLTRRTGYVLAMVQVAGVICNSARGA